MKQQPKSHLRQRAWLVSILAIGALGACETSTGTLPNQSGQSAFACADEIDVGAVETFYRETRPGAVLPITGRKLGMKEMQVAAALASHERILLAPDFEALSAILGSLRDWGADTNVRLVVSSKGWHPFDFPSKVPMLQNTPSVEAQFFDVFTADERTVRMHIDQTDLALLALFRLPGKSGEMTRGIALYSHSGDLVMSIYASQAGKPFDQRAVNGFAATWARAQDLPKLCPEGERT